MFTRLASLSRGCHTLCAGMELKTVTSALKKFAPTTLAGSWDNVGLLIEPTAPHNVQKMMLTNDLSETVMEEAMALKVNMILSYHPPIFAPIKRLNQGNWKEKIVIQCIENRIALYSPHTSYDAVEGGVNDWLISPFAGRTKPLETVYQPSYNAVGKYRIDFSILEPDVENCTKVVNAMENVEINSSFWSEYSGSKALRISTNANASGLTGLVEFLNQNLTAKKTIEITELQKIPIPKHGAGRICNLEKDISLSDAVDMVKAHLKLPHVRLAKAVGAETDSKIKTVAVCAGSGSSVLRGVNADLYITGEMSHHEVLDAVHRGRSVILCDHSNTERGYLDVLQKKLNDLFDQQVNVIVSAKDADPLQIV